MSDTSDRKGYIALYGGDFAVHIDTLRTHTAHLERFLRALPFVERMDASVETGGPEHLAIIREAKRAGLSNHDIERTMAEYIGLGRAFTDRLNGVAATMTLAPFPVARSAGERP